MNTITSASSMFSRWLLQVKARAFPAVALLIVMMALSSCYLNFFRTNTKTSIDRAAIKNIGSARKYFVVHMGNGVQGLENVSFRDDTVRGTLVPLPLEHTKYLSPNIEGKNRIRKPDMIPTLMEVHLYAERASETASKEFISPLTQINRMDVYELDERATRTNHILSTVGIVAGGVTVSLYVAAIIVLATQCNCPQVYIHDDGQYQFASGLYSGAMYSTLERTDYLPLQSLAKKSGDIQLKIGNAPNEEQYINQVNLIQVEHAPGVKILPDRHGKILAYQELKAPIQAVSGDEKQNEMNLLKETDEKYFTFNDEQSKNGFSKLVLKFGRPARTSNAKLVINARNSKWAGYIHEEFVSMFGDSYSKWSERQEKADPAVLNKWQTDQALPLMAYIKTAKGWKFVDYFPLIGNTATRDLVMEFELPETGTSEIEIKLETAYRFWDIDFAAVDYSDNNTIKSSTLKPLKITRTNGIDETENLKSKDSLYSHLVNEEAIEFTYSLLPPKTSASYFLVSGGYYHNLRQYKGKANTMELYKFRKKGAFDNFSRKKYFVLEQQVLALTKNN
ncbi:MAG: hypothetical protein WKF89_04045 [Chitinophagaceae bacterium]